MKKLLTIGVFYLLLTMIVLPQQSFAATARGFELWSQIVLPALLPFFICAELLVAVGAMDFLGKKLHFLMRPLFNLPGAAALAVVMGYTSGFPTGAAVTASLRRQGLVGKNQAERLLAFTNNASPLFIIISVATGLLESPKAGIALLTVHYGLNLLIGFFLGLGSKDKSSSEPLPIRPTSKLPPLGTLLKDAAKKSGTNIALIGCYMVFFAVLQQSLGPLLLLTGMSEVISRVISGSLCEMTLGVAAASQLAIAFKLKLAIIGAIISFGGFSVQAQVAAMVSDTDISVKTYLICRLCHAVAAFGVLYVWGGHIYLPVSSINISWQFGNIFAFSCLGALTCPLLLLLAAKKN